MAQILSFPYAVWLVFSQIFANKRISVLLIIVLKVKHPWKGIRTLELEPQGAGFPELCSRNWILNPLCLTSSHHQRIQPCPVGVSGFYLCGTGIWGGSVQLCLFANRRLFPTRKAIWIRTACLAAAQRFSLKPAGNRWINRIQRYRLNPCKLLTLG